MKTIIELFDSEQLNNIALHLFFHEARIVYIGSKNVMTKRRIRALSRFFESRGCSWTPEFIEVERYDIPGIISAAESVLTGDPECLLDITGGDEPTLVAMGILSERHRIPLVQVNLRSGSLYQVFGSPVNLPMLVPMTVSQLALLYGGCLIRSDDTELATTELLRDDVRGLWRLCQYDRGFLNRAAAQLNLMADYTNELNVDTRGSGFQMTESARSVIKKLNRAGYLKMLYCGVEGLRFTYRSKEIKKLLNKGGMTLEVLTRIAAEDSGVFTDVRQGVVLDWDGVIETQYPVETRNEADVILLRGMTPIFISCKSGSVKREALYELEVVAERFGGKYAEKVLICSHLSGTTAANASLRRRAKDMGITLIENVCSMSLEELSKELSKLR